VRAVVPPSLQNGDIELVVEMLEYQKVGVGL